MNFLQSIKRSWGDIIITTIVVTTVVFFISAFMTPKFQVDIEVLVVQENMNPEADINAINRSSEYLSKVLFRVIFTESFLDHVLQAPFGIEKKFSEDSKKRKKEWRETVSVDRVDNTGIIHISVFDPDREEAVNIAKAIAWTMDQYGGRYHDGGEAVRVIVIDDPMVFSIKTKPNLYVNTLLGFIVGLMGSLGYIYFLKED